MQKEPLLLADYTLFELLEEADMPVSVVSMETQEHPRRPLPQMVKVLHRKEALEGLRNNRFSCLLAGPRRGPYWDRQRPFLSRIWDLRKKMGNDPGLRHYQICAAALSRGIPTAIVARSDCFHIDEWNHSLLRAAKICWLREFPIHPAYALVNTSRRLRRISNVVKHPIYQEMNKVRPISLGVADSKQTMARPATKRYDVFYSGADSSPVRGEAGKVLQRLKAEGKYQVYLPEAYLPQEDFYKACTESYLVISPAGGGWDCYRHYEVALCGSVPVMNYPVIRRYRPFLEGDHGLYHDLEENGLERCIRRALADRPRLVEMGQNARSHVLQYHLYSKLLRMMVKELLVKAYDPPRNP